MIYLSSVLSLTSQRDSFVTVLCKGALPANYAPQVLNLKAIADVSYTLTGSLPPSQKATGRAQPFDDSSERQIQVVAIGPALLTSAQPTIYITAKNLLIIKSILNMSHTFAELIGSSWYIILNTMQHLTWTLGLKPTLGSNGQLKHMSSTVMGSPNGATAPSNDQSGSMITTAIQTEIAFLCNMLSKLFESTRNLSEQALKDIAEALMQLSVECSDLASVKSGEPCLFAVAKLYETSVANLNRLELFWHPVTTHLLVACKHSNPKYREWCVDSICSIIRTIFNFKYSTGNNVKSNF